MTVEFTDRAIRQLDEIATYTARRHGNEQRDVYLHTLTWTCEVLLPRAWRRISREEPLLPGLRRVRAERHVIYFRVHGKDLEIVAVLHEKQLPAKHLLR